MTDIPEYEPTSATVTRVIAIVALVIGLIITITFFYIRSIDNRTAAALQPTTAGQSATEPYPATTEGTATYSSTSEKTAGTGNPDSIVDNGTLRLCGIDDGSLARLKSSKPNETVSERSGDVRNSCLLYREPEQQYIEVSALKVEPTLTAEGHPDSALPKDWLVVETGISSVFIRELADGWVVIDTAKPAHKFHGFVADLEALLTDAKLI